MTFQAFLSKVGVVVLFLVVEHLLIILLYVQHNSEPIKHDVAKDNYKRRLVKIYNDEKGPPGAYESRITSTWLSAHPVYGKFYIRERKVKRIVDILVIVSSAPMRIDRRNAIRSTWFTECVTTKKMIPACIFMTDYQSPDEDYHDTLKKEKETFKDIYLQLVGGGVTFGKRFLSHMVFAVKKYDFKYFLRMDDDVFFCFNRFLHELPNPMSKQFHWGWVHRGELPRAEESIFLMSRDVHEKFLLQDPLRMLCHPLADQMIAVWLKEMNIRRLLNHDSRIHHDPPVKEVPELRMATNICKRFIALHGTYPADMMKFWKNKGVQDASLYTNLTNHVMPMTLRKHFDWREMGEYYRFTPKLCITNPKWDTSKITNKKFYAGRQGNDQDGDVENVFADNYAKRTGGQNTQGAQNQVEDRKGGSDADGTGEDETEESDERDYKELAEGHNEERIADETDGFTADEREADADQHGETVVERNEETAAE